MVISSVAGKFGVPLRSGYSATKFALHGFYEALRAEEGRNGIRVTLVCPGYIRTDISLSALNGDGSRHAKMDPSLARGMPVAFRIQHAVDPVSQCQCRLPRAV